MTQLVGLPGLLCEPSIFDRMTARLGAPFRALALPDGDDFEALVAALAPKIPAQSVLVGMSMGSYLALALARSLKDRVVGVVLIGTTASADSPEAAKMREKVSKWALREGEAALADSLAKSLVAPARQGDPVIRQAFHDMTQAQGVARFAAHQSALAGRPDQTDSLGDITCPVLVLTGSEDAATPAEAGRAVAKGVAHGQFAMIDGAGHMPLLECPDVVASHVEDFLKHHALSDQK